MPITWLRVAVALYALGLVYVLVALTRSPSRAKDLVNRVALHAAYLGMVFHFVALAESLSQSGDLSLASLSVAASVLGFLIMVVFLIVYMVYQTTSPGVVVFPVVFLLTFLGASSQEPFVSEFLQRAARVADRAYFPDSHRVRRPDPQLQRQPAVPVSGARPQSQASPADCCPACRRCKSPTKSVSAPC